MFSYMKSVFINCGQFPHKPNGNFHGFTDTIQLLLLSPSINSLRSSPSHNPGYPSPKLWRTKKKSTIFQMLLFPSYARTRPRAQYKYTPMAPVQTRNRVSPGNPAGWAFTFNKGHSHTCVIIFYDRRDGLLRLTKVILTLV